MYMFMLSGYRNAMNMAQATELWIHCLGHFVLSCTAGCVRVELDIVTCSDVM